MVKIKSHGRRKPSPKMQDSSRWATIGYSSIDIACDGNDRGRISLLYSRINLQDK